MVRLLFLILGLTAATLAARADQVGHEIARKHAERGGGKYRDVRTLFIEGKTLIGGEIVDIRMWAERPNKLRVESQTGKRKVTQIYDGRHEPVITHSEVENGRPLRMSAGERKEFIANADFDGPLVDFAAKGYSVDYAGDEVVDGRPAKKLLVMNAQGDVFFLWIDAKSFEMVKRGVFRTANDKRVLIETTFSDFRPVDGSLQPHRIETKAGARTLYLMVLTRMVANSPSSTGELFSVPEKWPLLPVEFKSDTSAAAPTTPPAAALHH
ncbi:MAG: hypothetical protein KF715_15420 [Candidatus Didemnitutus sp.]|nr:hypothetical protein [Candidatus Didemnitutus sp.]